MGRLHRSSNKTRMDTVPIKRLAAAQPVSWRKEATAASIVRIIQTGTLLIHHQTQDLL